MVKIKRIKGDYSGLFASQQIDKNQLILVLDGNGFDVPTRTSIQVRDKHIEDVNGGFMNHHCDPSAVIVVVE